MTFVRNLGLRRRFARVTQILLVFSLAAFCAGCGGDADPESTTTESIPTTPIPTFEPPDSSDSADDAPITVPTSAPAPTATSAPTTPVPLEQPTASTVLLTTAFTNASKVTTVGIDEVIFGMTADEAAEAASTVWVRGAGGNANCYIVTPEAGPEGVWLWVVFGRVERVDIEHPDLRTPSALGIGNTLAELQSQLGDRLTSEQTDDGGVMATFTPTDPGDRDFRIQFELVDDQVVRYRSGRIGVVERTAGEC